MRFRSKVPYFWPASRPVVWATFAAAVLVVVLMTARAEAMATSLHQTPRVVSSSGGAPRYAGFQWKLFRIVYSGDGAAFLGGVGSTFKHLVWTTWTTSQGRGSGADWHNSCVPDCADGTYFAYPATLTVYRPRRVGGYLLFTRMTTAYTGARPPYPGYRQRSVTYKLDFNPQCDTFFSIARTHRSRASAGRRRAWTRGTPGFAVCHACGGLDR